MGGDEAKKGSRGNSNSALDDGAESRRALEGILDRGSQSPAVKVPEEDLSLIFITGTNYLRTNHPGYFEDCEDKRALSRACNIVKLMIDLGIVEEHETRFDNTRRYFRRDDAERIAGIEKHLAETYNPDGSRIQKPKGKRKQGKPGRGAGSGGGLKLTESEMQIYKLLLSEGRREFIGAKRISTGYLIKDIQEGRRRGGPLVVVLDEEDCEGTIGHRIEKDFQDALEKAAEIPHLEARFDVKYSKRMVTITPAHVESAALLALYREHVLEPEMKEAKEA